MFFISEPPCEYRDPWVATFDQRFKELCAGDRRVAYFYEAPDTSTFRYRVYNMIQTLRGAEAGIGAAYFCNEDRARFREIVDRAHVIVLCRMRYDDSLNELVSRARAQGKPVFYDVDDLVFNVDYAHLILKTLDQDLSHPGVWDHWFAYISRMGALQKLCTGAITTNTYLAGRIREFSGLPTHVIPNFMNREQLEVSERIFKQKAEGGFARTEEIHLGYFSGTPTHNHDFAMVAAGLSKLMREDPRLRLLVVGYLELRDSMIEFKDRITFYGLHDFVNLQRLMSLVEINLVPLLDNGFTNCKSELKYFEAAAVGTLTVATPIHTYANAIEDGSTGFLATSIRWEEKIRQAIEKVENGYAEMAQQARNSVLQRFAPGPQLQPLLTVLFGSPPVSENPSGTALGRVS